MESQDKKIIFKSDRETANLLVAAKKAAQKAIRENRVLGLSFTYTDGNKVMEVQKDGAIVFVKSIAARKSLNIKKGAILYVKEK